MMDSGTGSAFAEHASGCRVDIHIEAKGDVHIHACAADKTPAPSPCPVEPAPPRAEGTCIPLGLGCKPKQSRTQKLERLRARGSVPSALAASFFQTARRNLAGASAANDFEAAVFPVFDGMTPEIRAILACAVDSYETTPTDLRDAGLEPSILADRTKPVDTATLTAAVIREIGLRGAEAAFGDPAALNERPGLNRFFDTTGNEIPPLQLLVCRVNDLRVASHTPLVPLGERLPAEIQQNCELVLGADGLIQQNCSVQTSDCPGNALPDAAVCARVPDVANGDTVTLSGVNFINVDIRVQLRARIGSGSADVESHVFGDLATPLKEADGAVIRDCRVKDQLSFTVPDGLPPGIYELQLTMPNTTGFTLFGPTIVSNIEFINVVPPDTARFQIVAERLLARKETSPQSFGSDEVALTFLAVELLADGSTGSLQNLTKRFGNVDSGDSRSIEQPVYIQREPAVGMAMSITGFEVDSERAFRKQLDDFREAFIDYLRRAWDKLKEALIAGAGGAIKALGFAKGALAIAIAAVVAVAVIAVIARWAPADVIMDEAMGFSAIELAELTNVDVPSGGLTSGRSPQGLTVNVQPLEKFALTYREFRQHLSSEKDSDYEIFLRYNRIA